MGNGASVHFVTTTFPRLSLTAVCTVCAHIKRCALVFLADPYVVAHTAQCVVNHSESV